MVIECWIMALNARGRIKSSKTAPEPVESGSSSARNLVFDHYNCFPKVTPKTHHNWQLPGRPRKNRPSAKACDVNGDYCASLANSTHLDSNSGLRAITTKFHHFSVEIFMSRIEFVSLCSVELVIMFSLVRIWVIFYNLINRVRVVS